MLICLADGDGLGEATDILTVIFQPNSSHAAATYN